jgi:hypothetical protein
MHSIFCIPANQNLRHKPLNSSSWIIYEWNWVTWRYYCLMKCLCVEQIYSNLLISDFKNETHNHTIWCVSLLCIGDLFNIHPVMDRWIFQLLPTDCKLTDSKHMDIQYKVFELTEIMRKANDRSFVQTLNKVRGLTYTYLWYVNVTREERS